RPSGDVVGRACFGWILNGYDDWVFGAETALFTVRDHFKVASLDGFGLKDRMAAVGAAGAVLHYLTQHLRRDAASLTRISFYQRSHYLALDFTTLRHLEILEPLNHDAPRNASLYGALNRTVTPMGARRLRGWLSQPLATAEPILKRQEAVQTFVENSAGLESLRTQLGQVRDLERTIGRLSAGAGSAGDLIRDGFDPGLDELRVAMRGGKDWIAKLQQDEITRTGIQSLKVRFNSVFGYYIEVTKANLEKVPQHYVRKQTIANGERFVTPELKEMEGKILGAEERSVKLEYELFQRVREAVLGQLAEMQQTAAALAQLDVLGGFAATARLHNYCRPQMGDAGALFIRDGRH